MELTYDAKPDVKPDTKHSVQHDIEPDATNIAKPVVVRNLLKEFLAVK